MNAYHGIRTRRISATKRHIGPPYPKTVSCGVGVEVVAALDEIAARDEVSRSIVICRTLLAFLGETSHGAKLG